MSFSSRRRGTPLPVTAGLLLALLAACPAAEKPPGETTGPWQKRTWQTHAAKVEGASVRAELPEGRPLVYFLTLTDDRKATISTEHETLEE
jgi:hypothetical protein